MHTVRQVVWLRVYFIPGIYIAAPLSVKMDRMIKTKLILTVAAMQMDQV